MSVAPKVTGVYHDPFSMGDHQPRFPISMDAVNGINSGVAAVHALVRAKGFWDKPDHIVSIERAMDDSLAYLDEELRTSLQKVLDQPVRNKGELIALIISEASELLEGIRKKMPDGTPLMDDHVPTLTSEAAELADIVIRVFDYCGGFGIDLGRAIAMKHDFNASRPYKHGKKF